jgi:hypothetical protein
MIRFHKTTWRREIMEKEEKTLEEQQPTTDSEETAQEGQEGPAEVEETVQEDQSDSLKETTEKLWGSTKSAWNTAAFKAAQYKKLVQKKIDISTLHKKINSAHADLGKLIDDLRTAGKKNIMNQGEVKEILGRIDELKNEAVALEEEVEKIKTEEPPLETPAEESQDETADK